MRRFGHVALIYGRTGQVVEFYPPDAEVVLDGAPAAAATYSLWRGTQSNDDTPLLTGTATMDAVATTFSADSGYSQTNRRLLTLTATTDVAVGRRFLAATATTKPRREIVVPVVVTSATLVTVDEDLSFDYAASGTFKGLRHYFTLDATFITTRSNINVWGAGGPASEFLGSAGNTGAAAPPYRLRWVYTTADGTVRESWTSFDVVRAPAKANLSIQDLRSICPDIATYEFATQLGQDFAPQLVRAEEDFAIDAKSAGYDASAIRDVQCYDRLVLQRWLVAVGFAQWQSGNKPAWYDEAKATYNDLFNKLIKFALRVWVDLGSTGATAIRPATQLALNER